MFVVVTSLVLGLMLNSAKSTVETNNKNVRTLGSQIILLDRTMRSLEPEAAEARGHLRAYLLASLKDPNIVEEDPEAERALEAAGAVSGRSMFPTSRNSRSGTMRGSFIGRWCSSVGPWWTYPVKPSRRQRLSC